MLEGARYPRLSHKSPRRYFSRSLAKRNDVGQVGIDMRWTLSSGFASEVQELRCKLSRKMAASLEDFLRGCSRTLQVVHFDVYQNLHHTIS